MVSFHIKHLSFQTGKYWIRSTSPVASLCDKQPVIFLSESYVCARCLGCRIFVTAGIPEHGEAYWSVTREEEQEEREEEENTLTTLMGIGRKTRRFGDGPAGLFACVYIYIYA